MRQFIYIAIAVGAVIGFGHSHASAQVIHGCVAKNGTLKLVTDPTSCSPRETPISWNQTGPQGEQGEPGEPGVDGLDGPPGPTLRLFDASGNVLGIPWFMPGTSLDAHVFVEAIGLSMTRNMLEGNLTMPDLFYEFDFCQGQAYVLQNEWWANHLVGPYSAPLPSFFVVPTTGAIPFLARESISKPSGSCLDSDGVPIGPVVPGHPFTGTLPFPFPPATPFYVALPPEASP